MELRKAIIRVAKLAKITKKESSYIRFLPRSAQTPATLYVTDGICSSLVRVDEDLPNALLDSAVVLKAAKGPGELSIREAGYGQVLVQAGSAQYQLASKELASFPGLPPMPEGLEPVPGWRWVLGVVHAAEQERLGLAMSRIHFAPCYVEACDKARLARAEIEGPWGDALVPQRIFRAWPKGAVKAHFSATHAVFSIGMEEIRVACLAVDKYPVTEGLMPAEHRGPWALVEVAALKKAIELGRQVSYLGMVLVAMTPDSVVVKAAQSDQTAHKFVSSVPVLHGSGGTGAVFLFGKYLVDALAQLETPNVRVCWDGPLDPLRLESGPLVICIWQMSQ